MIKEKTFEQNCHRERNLGSLPKSGGGSGCILIFRINEISSRKPSLSESVEPLCDRQGGINGILHASCSVTLRRLQKAIQKKLRGMLSLSIVLLHDIARAHTTAVTKQNFRWGVFDKPPKSQDLASSDFNLFSRVTVDMRTVF